MRLNTREVKNDGEIFHVYLVKNSVHKSYILERQNRVAKETTHASS